MPVTLTVPEVSDLTGVTVSSDDITMAASDDITMAAALIDEQTSYTVDEHVTDRLVAEILVKAGWAMCAVRVSRLLSEDGDAAVISETQGDYSYTEDAGIARSLKLGQITDGRPAELLRLPRGYWVHR